jgi:hypothetical protein
MRIVVINHVTFASSDGYRHTSSELPTHRPSCRCGRVPHVCPRNITTMIRMHTMHRESPAMRVALRQAQPSQREGQGFESP